MNTPTTPPLGFFRGVGSVFRACSVLWRRPKIAAWLSIPFGITILLDGLLFYFAYDWLRATLTHWLGQGWFSFFADLLLLASLAFALFWSFTFILLTASELVLDFISEAVEESETGLTGNGPEGAQHILRGILISIQQAVIITALQLVMLALSVIPVLGQVLFFGFTIWALGYSMFSIPSGRKLHSLRERLSLSWLHLRGVMGLGVMAFITALIPFLNLLLLPAFVVAGTLLFLDTQAIQKKLEGV
jgi:CysZ protein